MKEQVFNPSDTYDESFWTRRFLVLLLAVAAARFIFLVVSPLELSPDEAYYWDWSRSLSWGYYSKPPMVAWLIKLATSLLPVSEIGVRFPAAFLSVLTLIGIFLTGRKMAGAKAGFWGALAYSATVGSAVAGYIMTIDAPLLCFWIWTIFFFWSALEETAKERGNGVLMWLLAGLACGLGLLSKQTMVAVSGAVFLFLLVAREGRLLLKKTGPYLFFIVQLLAISPFLLWNYYHDWITFLHTAHHFEGVEKAKHLRLDTFFEFIGSQVGIVTPVLFLLVICASATVLALVIGRLLKDSRWEAGPFLAPLFLEISGFLPLLAVALLSFEQRVNANWPAPFYLSLCVLLGMWLRKKEWHLSRWQLRCQGLFRLAVGVGLFMVLLTYLMPFIFVYPPLAGKSYDPTVRVRGWRELGMAADAIFEGLPRPEKSFVVARRRQTVSELAFYMKCQPRVYRWNGPTRKIKSQYELWPGPVDKLGWDALVIIEADKDIKGLDGCFSSFTFLKKIKIPLGSGRFRIFNAYLGRRLERWAPT